MASLVEALRRHRREQAERRLALGSAWKDLDAICEGGDGQILHPDTVVSFIDDWLGMKASGRCDSMIYAMPG